jgi:hypothetical protein
MPAQKLLKPRRDLTNKKFGKLTVTSFSHYKQSKNRRFDIWNVKCLCGNEKKVQGNSLVTGGTCSCGCLLKANYKTLADRTRKRNSLPKGKAAFNSLINSYRTRAKLKNHSFSLTEEEFKMLVTSNCQYCGVSPKTEHRRKKANGSFLHNGIDRLDSNYGYSLSNCITACEICNKAKRDLSLEEFVNWLTRITSTNIWKKFIKA